MRRIITRPDAARSRLMSRVRQRGTAPEIAVGCLLRQAGERVVSHPRRLPGAPDFVVSKERIAIFVHGCFWHRHPGCKASSTPKSNVSFWADKFRQNIARDRRVVRQLRGLGYRVITIWECQTKTPDGLCRLERRIDRFLATHA